MARCDGLAGSEFTATGNFSLSVDNGHGGTYSNTYSAGEKIWVNTFQIAVPGNDDRPDPTPGRHLVGHLALRSAAGGEWCRNRFSRAAAGEDFAAMDPPWLNLYAFWAYLRMPILLLRARRELLPGLGFIIAVAERDRFGLEVSSSQVVEVEANHFGIITAAAAVEAIQPLGPERCTAST